MNITNSTVAGMTPQEKEVYFNHMEKRHREEKEKLEYEKERLKAYKESVVNDILKSGTCYSKEELMKKPIRTLERMW